MNTSVLTAISSLRNKDAIPHLVEQLRWPQLLHLAAMEDGMCNRDKTPPFGIAAFHEDILCHIIPHLNWPTLMAMRRCPEPAHSIAQQECQQRIFDELTELIPDKEKPAFFVALQSCNGAIVGSTARRVLQRNNVLTGPPLNELTICTPCGWGGHLHKYLSDIGYTSESVDGGTDEEVGPEAVRTVMYSMRGDNGKLVRYHRIQSTRQLTLTDATSSLLTYRHVYRASEAYYSTAHRLPIWSQSPLRP